MSRRYTGVDNKNEYYDSKEQFLLKVNLNDGSFEEVAGSRGFGNRVRKWDTSINNWKDTYSAPDQIEGYPTLSITYKVGDKIYFPAVKYDHETSVTTQRWSYFDLTTNTYGFAVKDGALDGTQETNTPENFFPAGDPTSSTGWFFNRPVYGAGSLSSTGGSTVDLAPIHKRIDDNKSAIRKNKKAIDTNRTNINNLGDGIAASTALGAALSALPVTPDDAPFSCGVGSGAYSSRFAMGLGCVAKLNQRLSLNAGGSHVFGGSSNYGGGSLDSVAWRGGFVLKLGKLDSPAATNEQLQSQLNEVKQENASIKEENAAIRGENAVIKAKYSTIEEQNAVITQQNKALMARLERLEAIALGQQPATTTASLK